MGLYALTSSEQQREHFWQPSGTRFRIENVVVQCLCKADHSHYKPEEGANWSTMNPLYSHGIAWHMVNKVIYCHIPIYVSKRVITITRSMFWHVDTADLTLLLSFSDALLWWICQKTEQMMANRHVHSAGIWSHSATCMWYFFFNEKMWDVKIKLNSPYCCFKNVSLFRKKGKWAAETDTMLQQHYMQ